MYHLCNTTEFIALRRTCTKTRSANLTKPTCPSFSIPRPLASLSYRNILFTFLLLFVDTANPTIATRPVECYSCMSPSYMINWNFLKQMYIAPKNFTPECDEPVLNKKVPTVLCGSVCVTLLEPNVEAGVFIGFKYIRGCVDRVLRHGFNQSAFQIHRFNQLDKCRQLPRASLFNQPRQLEMAITGTVQLCTCFGDRCNGASSGGTPYYSQQKWWSNNLFYLIIASTAINLFNTRLLPPFTF